MWNKNAKPNTANIVRRIEAAQEAIDAAMDLCKRADRMKPVVPLNNAYRWLVEANRRTRSLK